MSEDDLIPIENFCRHYGVEISFIHSLEEYGLLEVFSVKKSLYVSSNKIAHLEKLVRMHYEMDINVPGIEAISHLLEKIESLQGEVRLLKKKLDLYK